MMKKKRDFIPDFSFFAPIFFVCPFVLSIFRAFVIKKTIDTISPTIRHLPIINLTNLLIPRPRSLSPDLRPPTSVY